MRVVRLPGDLQFSLSISIKDEVRDVLVSVRACADGGHLAF